MNGLYGVGFIGGVLLFTGLFADINCLGALGCGILGFSIIYPIVIVALGLSAGIHLYRKLTGRGGEKRQGLF